MWPGEVATIEESACMVVCSIASSLAAFGALARLARRSDEVVRVWAYENDSTALKKQPQRLSYRVSVSFDGNITSARR